MTEDEARELAIRMGALKPQGFMERMADGFGAYNNGQRVADSPRAQSRLQAWTRDIMDGRDPRTGQPLL